MLRNNTRKKKKKKGLLAQAEVCSDLGVLLNSPLTALTPLPTRRKRAPKPKLMPLTRTVYTKK